MIWMGCTFRDMQNGCNGNCCKCVGWPSRGFPPVTLSASCLLETPSSTWYIIDIAIDVVQTRCTEFRTSCGFSTQPCVVIPGRLEATYSPRTQKQLVQHLLTATPLFPPNHSLFNNEWRRCTTVLPKIVGLHRCIPFKSGYRRQVSGSRNQTPNAQCIFGRQAKINYLLMSSFFELHQYVKLTRDAWLWNQMYCMVGYVKARPGSWLRCHSEEYTIDIVQEVLCTRIRLPSRTQEEASIYVSGRNGLSLHEKRATLTMSITLVAMASFVAIYRITAN